MAPKMLSSRDLAERWNLCIRTIDRWRYVDFGPPFLKIGGRIRYRIEDVIEFEQLAMKKKSMTIREFKNSTPPDKEPTAEAAPTQRLSVRDVVAGLQQDLQLAQGQVQAIPEAD